MFFALVLLVVALTPCIASAGEFGAYYTKINSGEEFEKYSRTREHADIIVDLGDKGEFVFWRGSSYLPYLENENGKWYVDEIIPRKGDGTDTMPDRVNAYSHVSIIKSDSDKVIVHWRYLPDFGGGNPHKEVDATKFVDEYFRIAPNGNVMRTIRKGTEKINDWNNQPNRQLHTFTITPSGFVNSKLKKTNIAPLSSPVENAPVVENIVIAPKAWWKFDETKGDVATESIINTRSDIVGHKSLWRTGVSGTALQFDGYNSNIKISADKTPKITEEITLEAWIVIGAYPWSVVPIVQQCDDVPEKIQKYRGARAGLPNEEGEDNAPEEEPGEGRFEVIFEKEDDTGYFFGIDGNGMPCFKLKVGDTWEELVSDTHLERTTWYHLAATYTKDTGKMTIYVDGKPAGEKLIAKANIAMSSKDLSIGKGKIRRPLNPVRKTTFPASYAFDGLLDEIRIYDVALSSDQVAKSYENFNVTVERRSNPDMDKRALPVGRSTRKFGAYYTKLKFYDVWDNLWRFSGHPDVVVEFKELPTKFIFWRGVGYIPMMVNEKEQWFTNEFNETWNRSGGMGCMEPMSDKEAYTNHARIIENTPARVVVHWRYPLIDVNHVMANYDDKTGWCDWSDWYFYIYPDGVASKGMRCWTHGEPDHEWQESIAIIGPNSRPEDNIELDKTLTMVNLNGEYTDFSWADGPPDDIDSPEGRCIQHIDFTGEYDPITISKYTRSWAYNDELTPYSKFSSWNHWPVSQMPSDGRNASYPDRAAHSSLSQLFLPPYIDKLEGDAPYYERVLMEGMLKEDPTELVPLAKSWMQAPKLVKAKGCDSKGYDRAQRAYLMTAKSSEMSFSIDASEDNPIANLCFVIKNWGSKSDAELEINGEPNSSFKQGNIRDTDGTQTKIIWVLISSNTPVELNIDGADAGPLITSIR